MRVGLHGFDIPYKYKLKGFYNFDDHTLCIVAPHKHIEKMLAKSDTSLMHHDLVMGRSVNPADILLIGYSQVWTQLKALLLWLFATGITLDDDITADNRGVTRFAQDWILPMGTPMGTLMIQSMFQLCCHGDVRQMRCQDWINEMPNTRIRCWVLRIEATDLLIIKVQMPGTGCQMPRTQSQMPKTICQMVKIKSRPDDRWLRSDQDQMFRISDCMGRNQDQRFMISDCMGRNQDQRFRISDCMAPETKIKDLGLVIAWHQKPRPDAKIGGYVADATSGFHDQPGCRSDQN